MPASSFSLEVDTKNSRKGDSIFTGFASSNEGFRFIVVQNRSSSLRTSTKKE